MHASGEHIYTHTYKYICVNIDMFIEVCMYLHMHAQIYTNICMNSCRYERYQYMYTNWIISQGNSIDIWKQIGWQSLINIPMSAITVWFL